MARLFPGAVTDYVTMGDLAGAEFTRATNWSWLGFVRLENTAADERNMVSKFTTATGQRQIALRTLTGASPAAVDLFVGGSGGIITTAGVIAINTWYLVVLTHTTATGVIRLYVVNEAGTFLINGTTGTHPGDVDTTLTAALLFGVLGTDTATDPWDGEFAHFTYVTGKIVSTAEISAFLACPSAEIAVWNVGNNLIFYLPDLLTDSGPLGNDGTLVGTGTSVVADPSVIVCGPPEPPELTGTVTASVTEDDIVAGGETIIITLNAETWKPNTVVPPTLATGESTESGNNTAEASWAVAYPNAAAGDLIIFGISWDDSTTTTNVAEPAGPNGETLSEVNATPAVDSNTACRCKVWYTIATGAWTASTLTFTPTATEQWTGACIVVPAGEFDGTTPIGANTTDASAAVTETAVKSAAFSAGATDGDGRLFCWTAVNQDPQTLAANWTQHANTDRGIVSGGMFSRNAAVTDSESIAEATVATIAGDDWCSVSFIVRPPTITPFEAARQAIIDGLDSAQSEATGWNAEVRDNLPVTAVVRTSDTVVIITLTAQAGYNITAQETITATVPATALVSGSSIAAEPTFTVDASGGGAYTLTATAGSFAITGTAASLKFGRVLAAAAGSVAVTGTAANLLRGYPLTAAAGAVPVTGTAAGLLYGRAVTATAGAVPIAGVAAGMLYGHRLDPTAGAVPISGTDVSFITVVLGDPGVVPITGTDATLTYNVDAVLAAGAGAVPITGTSAGLLVARPMAAVAGAVPIAGTSAGLLFGHTLSSAAGTVPVAGTAAGLLTSRVLAAQAGAVAVTGTAATLTVSYRIVAAAGAVAITGTAAVLELGGEAEGEQNFPLEADPGAVAVVGTGAGLLYARIMVAGTAGVTVTGSSAGLIIGAVIFASPGTVPITGQPAGFVWAHRLVAAAGAVPIDGASASLFVGERNASQGTTAAGRDTEHAAAGRETGRDALARSTNWTAPRRG